MGVSLRHANPVRSALIADDDEFFRMAMMAVLKELGFGVVIETDSFEAALESLAATGELELGVFDLRMPGIEGAAALRTIRELFPVKKLVVVTASTNRADILSSLQAGAHGYICKGEGVGKLQNALRQVLEGAVYVPPTLTDIGTTPQESATSGEAPISEQQIPKLSRRQMEVLKMLVEGKANKEIARSLDLGPGTVKVHLAALYRALGVRNRSSAAVTGASLLRRLH